MLPIEQDKRVLASKRPVALRPEYAEKYHLYAGLEAGFISTSHTPADIDTTISAAAKVMRGL